MVYVDKAYEDFDIDDVNCTYFSIIPNSFLSKKILTISRSFQKD